MSVTIKWDKSDIIGCVRAFGRLKDQASDGANSFVDDIAKAVYKKSQIRVPKRTGRLKKSGKITRSSKANLYHAEVSYGNSSTKNKSGKDYAIFAHEIPPNSGGRWHTGNKHAAPTTYKYLEIPAREETSPGVTEPKIFKEFSPRFNRVWYN